MVRRIKGYTPYKGEITQRANGAMISTETRRSYDLCPFRNLQERGSLFISPQTEVYEGMNHRRNPLETLTWMSIR